MSRLRAALALAALALLALSPTAGALPLQELADRTDAFIEQMAPGASNPRPAIRTDWRLMATCMGEPSLAGHVCRGMAYTDRVHVVDHEADTLEAIPVGRRGWRWTEERIAAADLLLHERAHSGWINGWIEEGVVVSKVRDWWGAYTRAVFGKRAPRKDTLQYPVWTRRIWEWSSRACGGVHPARTCPRRERTRLYRLSRAERLAAYRAYPAPAVR